jgi:hypothetical protein
MRADPLPIASPIAVCRVGQPARAIILPSAWLSSVIVAVADGMKMDIATINVAISIFLNPAGPGS